MLVLAGRPVELDAHLERLSASLAALYGTRLSATDRDAVLDVAAGIGHGKLRVTVAPGTVPRIEAEEIERAAVFPTAERGIALRSTTVAGGLGGHKWADRRLLEEIEATFPSRQLALLLDTDGAVLEASRASVFHVEGERLTTPPTDGRILPSIARQQAIEVARAAGIEVDERPLRLEDLHAHEVFLTGSVRGLEPVVSIDGVGLLPPGELSERVAAGLKSRWLEQAEPVAAGAGGPPAGPPAR
jgi:para-aminobenzoate synthetase/4-amino-4-deoxychorismate lyase